MLEERADAKRMRQMQEEAQADPGAPPAGTGPPATNTPIIQEAGALPIGSLFNDEQPDAKRSKAEAAPDTAYEPAQHPIEARTPSSILESQLSPEVENLNDTVPRLVIRQLVTDDSEIIDDGFRWRKYGQKNIKENPNYPRSYYRCTADGCKVKKYVERSLESVQGFYETITTYEGIHSHSPPPKKPHPSGKLVSGFSQGLLQSQERRDPIAAQLAMNKLTNPRGDNTVSFSLQGLGNISSNVPGMSQMANQPVDRSGLATHMLESLSQYGNLAEGFQEDARDWNDKILQRVVQQQQQQQQGQIISATPVEEGHVGPDQDLGRPEPFSSAKKGDRLEGYEQGQPSQAGAVPAAPYTSAAQPGAPYGMASRAPVANASALLSDILQASIDAMPNRAHRQVPLSMPGSQGGITIPQATLETLLRQAVSRDDGQSLHANLAMLRDRQATGVPYRPPTSATPSASAQTSQALLSMLLPDYYQPPQPPQDSQVLQPPQPAPQAQQPAQQATQTALEQPPL